LDPHTIELTNKNGDKQIKTAENILIAVGGRPNYLNVPGSLEYTQSSDDIFWT
jgi:pyruvate/2-oxoglutarate dehydrogenase complex dihydrolipoamide dehydrogenase (E3) component